MTVTAQWGRPKDQALDALKLAQEARLRHSAIKRELKGMTPVAARLRAADIIEQVPGDAARIPVGKLLRSCPLIAESKARRFLSQAGVVAEAKRVEDLTDRQREALVEALRS